MVLPWVPHPGKKKPGRWFPAIKKRQWKTSEGKGAGSVLEGARWDLPKKTQGAQRSKKGRVPFMRNWMRRVGGQEQKKVFPTKERTPAKINRPGEPQGGRMT